MYDVNIKYAKYKHKHIYTHVCYIKQNNSLFHIVCESTLSYCTFGAHMAPLSSEIELWFCLSYLATSGTIIFLYILIKYI